MLEYDKIRQDVLNDDLAALDADYAELKADLDKFKADCEEVRPREI
ncbi:MAG: hypothetical protein II818_02775 [Aeriscardovia sp.]|nr:hypothetical protein [Aeriscardovia sp.]